MTTATQFEPIDRPLDLSPVDFVSRARERGLRLVFNGSAGWYGARPKCGCLVGIAAVLADPKRTDSYVSLDDAASVLPLSMDDLEVLADGYENEGQIPPPGTREADLYAKGQAVARATGLEEEEQTA